MLIVPDMTCTCHVWEHFVVSDRSVQTTVDKKPTESEWKNTMERVRCVQKIVPCENVDKRPFSCNFYASVIGLNYTRQILPSFVFPKIPVSVFRDYYYYAR